MKIRKISAILVAVMILSLASGCGKSKSESDFEKKMKNYSKYVELGKYKGVEYTPQHTEVTEDDIQYKINNLISENTEVEEATTGIATMGDTVNIDFVGYIDGVEFDGGSSQGQGAELTLGSGRFIDGFEEQVAGHSPGDAFDVTVTFPDDYTDSNVAGKEAVFDTTLNYIKISHEPEYNDALVASATDYKTTEDYEKSVREELEQQYAESDLEANKSAAYNNVIESCNVTEYPEAEVEERIQSIMDNIEEEAAANGLDVSSYLANYGMTVDSLKENVRSSTKTYIREKMILSAIALEMEFDVTDEEREEKVNSLMQQYGATDKESLMKMYGFTDDDIAFSILGEKIRDYIFENAVEVEATETDATEDDPQTTMVDDYGTTEED